MVTDKSSVRQLIETEGPVPDGYNIGINVGEAAGQTVAHAHLHVIPGGGAMFQTLVGASVRHA